MGAQLETVSHFGLGRSSLGLNYPLVERHNHSFGAEQRRIVADVEELMDLVDQLEAQLAASEEAGTKLLDALVAELAPSN